jgi:hypothetical protein
MSKLPLFGLFGLAISFSAAVVMPLFAGCSSTIGGAGTGGQGGEGSHVGGHAGGVAVGGAGGSTPAVECDAIKHDEDPSPIKIRLVNHTASDVYIGDGPGACDGSPPPYTIADPGGVALDFLNPTGCGWTCAKFSDCFGGCTMTSTCLQHHATRIAPNAKVELEWRGTVIEQRKLPAACLTGQCEQSCVAWVKPPAVPLTFTGTVWTEQQCQFGTACACTPDASGTCVSDDGEVAGNPLTAAATLALGATSVDIVFE